MAHNGPSMGQKFVDDVAGGSQFSGSETYQMDQAQGMDQAQPIQDQDVVMKTNSDIPKNQMTEEQIKMAIANGCQVMTYSKPGEVKTEWGLSNGPSSQFQ